MNKSARNISHYQWIGPWSGLTHDFYVYYDLSNREWVIEYDGVIKARNFSRKKNAMQRANKQFPGFKLISERVK
jgi:hypothetical protein